MERMPIQSLDTSSAPPRDSSIHAVVTLLWPYSSSTRQCALLLADPDFRLRNNRGQVRIRFSGPSAEAVAKSRLGIGDEVVLRLGGARWVEDGSTVKTPGRSVGAELMFERRLGLRFARNGEEVNVDVDAPASPQKSPQRDVPLGTPMPKPLPVLGSSLRSGLGPSAEGPVYSSPAFARRIHMADGPSLEPEFDPFADEDFETSPRKRQRVSFGDVRSWRFDRNAPSPLEATASDELLANEEIEEDGDEGESIMVLDGTDDRPVKNLFESSSVAVPSTSPSSGRPMQQDLVDLTDNTPTKPGRAAMSNYAFEDASVKQSPPKSTEAQTSEQLQQPQGTPPPVARAEMPPPPLPRLRMPSPPFHEDIVMTDGEAQRPKTPKLQPVSGASLPLPSPFPTEDSQQPMFPVSVSLGEDLNSDLRHDGGDVASATISDVSASSPARKEGSSSPTSPSRIDAEDVYENDVVSSSSPIPVDLVKDTQNVDGDEKNKPGQTSLESVGSGLFAAGIQPGFEREFEQRRPQSPRLAPQLSLEKVGKMDGVEEKQTVVVSDQENGHARLQTGGNTVSDQTPSTEVSATLASDLTPQNRSKSGPKPKDEHSMTQTFRTLFGYTTSPDIEPAERQPPSPRKTAGPWMTEEETEALAMIIDREMPFREPSPARSRVDSDFSSEDEDTRSSSVQNLEAISEADGLDILNKPQQEEAADEQLPTLAQDTVGGQPRILSEGEGDLAAFMEEGMHGIKYVIDAQRDSTDEEDAERAPQSNATPLRVVEEQQEALPIEDLMEDVEASGTFQRDGHAGMQVAAESESVVEEAASSLADLESLTGIQIPATATTEKDGAQSNPVILSSSPASSPGQQTSTTVQPRVADDPMISAVDSSLMQISSSPRSTMAVEGPDQADVDMSDMSQTDQEQEVTQGQELLHRAVSGGPDSVDSSQTTPIPENSWSTTKEGDTSQSYILNEDYPVQAIQPLLEVAKDLPEPSQGFRVLTEAEEMLNLEPRQGKNVLLSSQEDQLLSMGEEQLSQYNSHDLTDLGKTQQIEDLTALDEPLPLHYQQSTVPQIPTSTQAQIDAANTVVSHGKTVARKDGTSFLDARVADAASPTYQQMTQDLYTPAALEAQASAVAQNVAELPPSPINSQSQSGVSGVAKARTSRDPTKAAMPPTPQFTQGQSSTKSVENLLEREEDPIPASPMEAKTPSRYSLRSRLSNVPDVISAWFTPRRTGVSQESADQTNTDIQSSPESPSRSTPRRQTRSSGYSTAKAYFTPLSNLDEYMNVSSQRSGANKVDVLALVTDSTKLPSRAKAGPRDFFTIFRITDASLPSANSTRVEVFRPWRAVLPTAEAGDVVLLRAFTVKSRKRQSYLLSTDESAWCVWRFEKGSDAAKDGEKPIWAQKAKSTSFHFAKEEIKGPPVEFGDEERERARHLHMWWKGEQVLPGETSPENTPRINGSSDTIAARL